HSTHVYSTIIIFSSSIHSTTSFFSYSSSHHRDLHSFPTRRSSDLFDGNKRLLFNVEDRAYIVFDWLHLLSIAFSPFADAGYVWRDRKSTRLNSSHGSISYAVFCLKKKKKNENNCITKYKRVMRLLR